MWERLSSLVHDYHILKPQPDGAQRLIVIFPRLSRTKTPHNELGHADLSLHLHLHYYDRDETGSSARKIPVHVAYQSVPEVDVDHLAGSIIVAELTLIDP